MNIVRRNFIGVLALFAASTALLLWEIALTLPLGIVLFGGLSLCSLVLVLVSYRNYRNAALICENPILTVPSAILSSSPEAPGKMVEETIVSPFGVLVGGRAISWGHQGIDGVKLWEIQMDSLYITLIFGDKHGRRWVKLPHGLEDIPALRQVQSRLRYETGVEAKITVTGQKDQVSSTETYAWYCLLDAQGSTLLSFSIQDGLLLGQDGRYLLEGLDALESIQGLPLPHD